MEKEMEITNLEALKMVAAGVSRIYLEPRSTDEDERKQEPNEINDSGF